MKRECGILIIIQRGVNVGTTYWPDRMADYCLSIVLQTETLACER